MAKTHIIIGASAAGISAVQKLRQLDATCSIICISDELQQPYNKCMLADYVAGIKELAHVYTLTAEQAKQKNITLLLGKRVVQLRPEQKEVVLDDGTVLAYDTVLLATGTSPVVPDIPGADCAGIFTFHYLQDMERIIAYIERRVVKKVVVVGSGLSGLECADALLRFNVDIHVVEMRDRVLASLITQQGSHYIQQRMAACNISFHPNQRIQEIFSEGGAINVALCATQLDADMVIFAIGLRPNLTLAQQASITCSQQGIVTNEYMQTSVPSVYAAGDIAVVYDQLSGQMVPSRLWPDAMLQGLVAACHMAGAPRVYPGITPVISSSFFGIKFAVCGPILNLPGDSHLIVNQGADFYHAFLLADDRLKGFLLVGSTAGLGKLRQMLMTGVFVGKNDLL